MEALTAVLERADEVMSTGEEIEKIELPALREVMEQVASSKDSIYGYKRHSDHSKTSTRGCVMGCIVG
jgi:hypothetical protein